MQEADLSVTKVCDFPDPINFGEVLTYTIRVTNNGPDNATNIYFLDYLPNSVVLSAYPYWCYPVDTEVICNVGTLVYDDFVDTTITVLTGLGGIITNTVEVFGSEFDPNPYNNTFSEATTVLTPQPSTDLNIINMG